MENAVDALKIAAAILVFIIAIASSFSLFGTAKQTADSIITMRDRQAYLDSADLDGGILYTSSSEIQKEDGLTDTEKEEKEKTLGVTTRGDRIVGIEDVMSTVYRYSKEKYGVTIVTESGEVLARYDSNTEQIISQWNNIDKSKLYDAGGYLEQLNENTKTKYISESIELFENADTLERLYTIEITGSSSTVRILWGNDEEIKKRIACDFKGEEFVKSYTRNEIDDEGNTIQKTVKQIYTGKGLISKLTGKRIVEVTNEIDNSTYLKDTNEDGTKVETNLLQEYTMPTVEIIYIILN